MNPLRHLLLPLLLVSFGLGLTQAQTSPTPAGETTLQLDVGFGVRAVPPARLAVPAGDSLRLIAPAAGAGYSYIWTKNGRALPGANERTLVVGAVGPADAGTYACQLSSPTTLPQPSQLVVLAVGPSDRLINLSTRGVVSPGQSLVSGFAVSASGQGKKLIVRAIGPSLALFGVADPLRQPVLRFYDQNGRPYENGYAYPPVVGGPTYESDLAESLARTGAFPLPAGTRDVVVMMPFVAGAYTAEVTSGDGSTGTVLLEIYEVP